MMHVLCILMWYIEQARKDHFKLALFCSVFGFMNDLLDAQLVLVTHIL